MNLLWLSSSKQVYFFVLVPRYCMTKLKKNLLQQRSRLCIPVLPWQCCTFFCCAFLNNITLNNSLQTFCDFAEKEKNPRNPHNKTQTFYHFELCTFSLVTQTGKEQQGTSFESSLVQEKFLSSKWWSYLALLSCSKLKLLKQSRAKKRFLICKNIHMKNFTCKTALGVIKCYVCYKTLGDALKFQLVESFLFNDATGSRDRTGGYQPRLDWEPQCCKQLRETLWTVPPRPSKSCGCRCTFGHWTSHDFSLDCERGNDAATGPNCRFDFIKLQWKPPCAVVLNMFCPLPSCGLFNCFVLTGCHSCQK